MKLDLGSGGKSTRGDGWIGVDFFVDSADVQALLWDLPYGDGEIDHLYSSHALEHVGKKDILTTLNEWRRVLRSGGTLELLVPNLAWCVRHWLQHQDSIGWELDILFGNQNHAGEFHRTGFTQETLRRYAEEAGFTVHSIRVVLSHGQETLCMHAEKK